LKSERRKTKYCLIAMAALLLVFLAQPALADKGASNTHQFYVPGEFKGTGGLFKANNFGWYSLTKYNITGAAAANSYPTQDPTLSLCSPPCSFWAPASWAWGPCWRRKKITG